MAVDKKAHFKAWDPGCTHILGDDKFYFLYAYYGGAEMERKFLPIDLRPRNSEVKL